MSSKFPQTEVPTIIANVLIREDAEVLPFTEVNVKELFYVSRVETIFDHMARNHGHH